MNRESWEQRRRKDHDDERERRQREQNTSVSVTWLDPPVKVGRVRVVGVCSDAADDVKRMYRVRL